MGFIYWYLIVGVILTIINLAICVVEKQLRSDNILTGIKVGILGVFLWPIFVFHWITYK